ncbi:hypothetical protein [Bacillus sp. T33-2]|uniref:hypothetical protein n=1 Tax=Bacillus sp. T33-2 TaxID=2054168 RepID=UPI000C75E0EC|nr:hypothetical protein [Bacillus sp. T33-2]PLR99500.1 hypothetical protein CVD19_00115 [Bacillus sp. T33-2]
MRPVMSEGKRELLLQLISQLEEGVGEVSAKLENNHDIETYDWHKYETAINGLYQLLNKLKEEVSYT